MLLNALFALPEHPFFRDQTMQYNILATPVEALLMHLLPGCCCWQHHCSLALPQHASWQCAPCNAVSAEKFGHNEDTPEFDYAYPQLRGLCWHHQQPQT